MPKIWENLVSKLESEKHPPTNPYARATSILQKAGYLKKGTRKLTKKGKAKE